MEEPEAKLRLRLLGELEVLRGNARVELPPSRKTRALLAYLAATGRPQRRERLCAMFWEIPDDPRGSLRWSLSRLRAVVDDKDAARIIADRETVAFDTSRCEVDLAAVRALDLARLHEADTERLVEAAANFRGEFLEGVDLPNSHDFQSWCAAEREALRRLNIRILAELCRRHETEPEAALSFTRRLVHADPFDEEGRAELLRLLVATGRRQEAESQFEAAERLFRELGEVSVDRLRRVWRTILRDTERGVRVAGGQATPEITTDPLPIGSRESLAVPFVGRSPPLQHLVDTLNRAVASSVPHVVVLLGEPGIGKSRLAAELAAHARARSVRVLTGRCYDFRLGAAYTPWVEALGELPLPEEEGAAELRRDRLFAALAEKVIGNGRTPVLLILDDIQWMDGASGDLLRFVLHMGRSAPLDAVLVAREGELPDNPPITAMLRNLRREHATQDLRLSPLAAEDVALLVRTAGREEDVARIVALSNGNPLYALELTRGLAHERDALPQTLKALVRDRVERLPPEAGELLRWASVFGTGARTRLLEALCGLEPETFVNALEVVERHEMLVPAGDAYGFTHELVREAIYTALSEPRRRLMHLKLARLMREEVHQARSDPLDIAHHASVGGDTGLAALACAEAGRQALRLFANADALTLARRGQHYAEALPEPARSERLIELAEIEHGARPLNDAEGFSVRLEQLAGVALDHGSTEHAWRCYKMLADIRWATGAWSDARRDTLHAELLSRTASDEERVVALAEAARCLAMLKRDLDLAEALVLEARDLARRTQRTANAIADANGLLAMYRGEFEDARRHLREARLLARREGDRLNEFLAVEHLLVF